jgi:hypothetical protein
VVLAPEPILTQPARGVTPRDQVEPLTADLRRLHITVSRQFLRELETARGGLSHAIPNATTEQVLQAALQLLLERQARARGQVKRPRKAKAGAALPGVPASTPAASAPAGAGDATAGAASEAASDARFEPPPPRRTGPREAIAAAVRRAVWARDGGRCSWPLDGGGCCGSTRRLELDHLVPWAAGGPTTADNLRVVCAAHNRLAARVVFGERWMGRYGGGGAGGAG